MPAGHWGMCAVGRGSLKDGAVSGKKVRCPTSPRPPAHIPCLIQPEMDELPLVGKGKGERGKGERQVGVREGRWFVGGR